MPYRTELRRPDLKGTFRCSLCNKIFCHSSSLSRHRMQAHFKSYTCTLCNKEITSNETLRAHMYKKHQISRMFMCRCCNWAFPDKTSLHIHMQAMATGNPGNVSIIAKSSSSPMPKNDEEAVEDMDLGQLADHDPQNANLNNSAMSSIFPSLASRDDLINRLRERAIIGNMVNPPPPNLDLASFFPNLSKFNPALAMLGFGSPQQHGSRSENGFSKENKNDLTGLKCESPTGSLDENEMKLNFDDDELLDESMMADVEYGDDSLCGSDDVASGGGGAAVEVDGVDGAVGVMTSSDRRGGSQSSTPSTGGGAVAVSCIPDEAKPAIDQLKAMLDGGINAASAGANGSPAATPAAAATPKKPSSHKRKVGWSELLNRAAAAAQPDSAHRAPTGDVQTPPPPPKVNASPLNSLLYRKKLSASLRNNQRGDARATTAATSATAMALAVPPPPPTSSNSAASLLNNLIQEKFPAAAAAFFAANAATPSRTAAPVMTPNDFAAMAAAPFFSALQQQLRRNDFAAVMSTPSPTTTSASLGIGGANFFNNVNSGGVATSPLNLAATNRTKEAGLLHQASRFSPKTMKSIVAAHSPINGMQQHFLFGGHSGAAAADAHAQRHHLLGHLTSSAQNAAGDDRHSLSSASYISPTDSAASTKSSTSLSLAAAAGDKCGGVDDADYGGGAGDCRLSLSPPYARSRDNATQSASAKRSSVARRSSPATAAGGASSPPSTTSATATSCSPACFQCQVFKGKLAQSENRGRFLESRTTSQESKISRLENRVNTLEANNRRYETEAVALRDHCESLERKILECQERALRYLSGSEYDNDTTRKILHDILETCRVYGVNGNNGNNIINNNNNNNNNNAGGNANPIGPLGNNSANSVGGAGTNNGNNANSLSAGCKA